MAKVDFSCLLFYILQHSRRELQRHGRPDEQPRPLGHPVQHQGQRQRPLHLQVRPARLWRYVSLRSSPPQPPPFESNTVLNVRPLPSPRSRKRGSFPLCVSVKFTAERQLFLWTLRAPGYSRQLSDVLFFFVFVIFSAGWWFEACGPSNLNGIYYPSSTSAVRYNGIKWYYWKGPNVMATRTTMMVRPANFRPRDIR